jgi:hypothetical protein
LTPALATQDVIDMTSSTGIKLYKSIVSPLETKFDGAPTKMMTFLDDVQEKANNCGWNQHLLSVNDGDPTNPQVRNLLVSHRMLSIEAIRAHATAYIGTATRLAQDSRMMYEFLRDSLTDGARASLATETAKYTITGTADGPLYLKTMLIKFYVETKATNYHLRQQLQRLPTKIAELNYNVSDFNDHVKKVLQNLSSGGETSDDLMVNLFEAYLSVNDTAFLRYIERKKDLYDEGLEELTAAALMDAALIKYNSLTLDEKWQAKSAEEEQIIALTAQLEMTQKKLSEISKLKKGKEKKDNKGNKKKGNKDSKNAKKGNKDRADSTKKKLPDWRTKHVGDKLTRDGKTWLWCHYHEYYADHETSDCRAKKMADANKKPTTDKPQSTGQTNKQNPALSIAKALVAISEGNEEISDDDT